MGSDLELLEAWRAGDRVAGNDLFERHFLVVCDFFRNKVPDGVDDLVQRTFITCIEAQSGFEGRSTFRSYLLGVARKTLLRHYREHYRDGATFAPLSISVCDLDPSPSAMALKHREHAALLEALRRIPIDLQVALELFFWEDLTMREMAEVLEVPPGTAASRLRRAKAALYERLHANADAAPKPDENLDRWAAQIRGSLPGRG